ncbi:MAG: dTDP-glucose 4,6-dehydratase [Actinomycetota bacterium]|nr:dTDP-glucose 4,6-dehydratase [Actinomycetota bacterium]
METGTLPFTRALVTGGAGFLGSHLCEQLLRGGAEVVCADNFVTSSHSNIAHLTRFPGFELIEHDVTEPLPLSSDCDLVLHLASAASPPDYFRLPIETLRAGSLGTANALDFAAICGARFLLASTSEVYGDPQENPQRETYWGHVNPIGPRSVYDEAKRYAEALVSAYRRARGANTAIARIFNTYGPRMRPDDGRMVPAFVGQALAGEPMTVTGSGKQTRSLCYVDDTIRGLISLAASDHPGPVNIGNPQELPVEHIAEEIRSLTRSDSAITHIDAATDDPQRRCPDISLARTALDWQPEVSLADGLERTVGWFARQLTGDPR